MKIGKLIRLFTGITSLIYVFLGLGVIVLQHTTSILYVVGCVAIMLWGITIIYIDKELKQVNK
jgi:hypothetical protein